MKYVVGLAGGIGKASSDSRLVSTAARRHIGIRRV